MDPLAVGITAGAVGGAIAVVAGRHYRARPRLRVTASLRGTTRTGSLYVRIDNDGRRPARDVRLRVAWTGADGAEHVVDARDVGAIEAAGASVVHLRHLHADLPRDREWRAIEARVTAANAAPAHGALSLQGTPREDAPPASVRYARHAPDRCADAPDGKHRFAQARVHNDGVWERWEVCAHCRYVKREPLTPDEEATQARHRAERARREQARLEREWARARDAGERAWERARARQREPPREPDETLPVEVALLVLGLAAEEGLSWERVVAAHRRLALQLHPDRNHNLDAAERRELERKMQDVNAARDRLREHLGVRVVE